jgi:hypothetical protein
MPQTLSEIRAIKLRQTAPENTSPEIFLKEVRIQLTKRFIFKITERVLIKFRVGGLRHKEFSEFHFSVYQSSITPSLQKAENELL